MLPVPKDAHSSWQPRLVTAAALWTIMLVPTVLTNALLCGLSARQRLDIHVIAFSLVYGRSNEQSGLVKVYFGSTRNLLKEKKISVLKCAVHK